MTKRKATDKDRDPGKETVKQVESTDGGYADEEKETALDTEVGEGLMQAPENPVGPPSNFCDWLLPGWAADQGQ